MIPLGMCKEAVATRKQHTGLVQCVGTKDCRPNSSRERSGEAPKKPPPLDKNLWIASCVLGLASRRRLRPSLSCKAWTGLLGVHGYRCYSVRAKCLQSRVVLVIRAWLWHDRGQGAPKKRFSMLRQAVQ